MWLCAVAPSRGRGLKQGRFWALASVTRRPFTGAWIETQRGCAGQSESARRPFTGAWIETVVNWWDRAGESVAPSRGRGLKPLEGPTPFNINPSPLHGGVD